MTKERFDLEAVRKRLNENPTEDSANANHLDDALTEIERLRVVLKRIADPVNRQLETGEWIGDYFPEEIAEAALLGLTEDQWLKLRDERTNGDLRHKPE